MSYQDDLSSASFQQQNIADDEQSIPGEWDEFEKVQPLDKGADEAKNSIDNPENADDDREKFHVKKDTQSQLEPQTYTQTFKVIY